MQSPDQVSIRNRLLRSLSAEDFALLRPHLEATDLPVGFALNEPDRPTEFVYFISGGIASVVIGSKQISGVEIGIVGVEGFVGCSVALDAGQTPHNHFMQAAGAGLRIEAEAFRSSLGASATLRSLMLRYVHAFMTQVSSTAYANANFSVDERLARWLLMCHDRVGDRIAMTHEFIALMLGVRRPGVTVATHVLEGEHMIKATRGLITVLDRERLKTMAGASYGMAEAEYERVLGAGAVNAALGPTLGRLSAGTAG